VDKLSTNYSIKMISDVPEFWKKFLRQVEDEKGNNKIFSSIVKQTQVEKVTETNIVISCSSYGILDYCVKRKSDFEDKIQFHAGKRLEVDFKVQEKDANITAPLLAYQPAPEDIYRRAGINPNLTFDNFAVSPTNQIAFAAAQSVSRSLGKSYNPLFIHGGVGFGKTHLVQSVARAVLENDPETSTLFCSSEVFVNELIELIQRKSTVKFKKKFRSYRLLIIDDIQFIAGKQTVQEEFFHTFNTIVSSGGQVILTSDRPPFEIKNLEDRLRSRFSGGLIVDVQQPDFELRTAILLIKAREKNITIDIESAKMIAEIVLDTRSLEGTLLSLYARMLSLNSKSIDLDLIESFFQGKKDIIKKKISPQDVIKTVCTYYNIKQTDIKGDTRKSYVAMARQIAMYILRSELNLNLDEVAIHLKRKDHTTVIHAVSKIKEKQMKDNGFQQELRTIIKSINSST